ncbi:hypothetical protein D1871_18420 [Nakamurella silvestris]|nr:hypothetical protein D1871_18420 [Nakamurella silvestris]
MADLPATAGKALEPLPPKLARIAALSAPEVLTEEMDKSAWSATPAELPEVAALIAQGWYPLDDAPRLVLLPAVWPTELRCWVPDRVPKVAFAYGGRGPAHVLPMVVALVDRAWEHESQDDGDQDEEFRDPDGEDDAGFPPPPKGRIWLLKSPWPAISVPVVISMIGDRAKDLNLDFATIDSSVGYATAADILNWGEDRLRAWWTGPEAVAFREWEAVGRTGNDVAAVVLAGLTPQNLDRLAPLSEAEALAWCGAVGLHGEAGIERVLLWRSLGLPVAPPPDLHYFADTPAKAIRQWSASGLTVPWMLLCQVLPMDECLDWRDRGYSPADVRDLAQADHTITAEEADAFAALGLDGTTRLRWIEWGFSAADAYSYLRRDVRPNEARVWRSLGLGPADVQSGQRLPSGYEIGNWGMIAGTDFRDIEHQVVDPPGTRGSKAASAGNRRRYADYL